MRRNRTIGIALGACAAIGVAALAFFLTGGHSSDWQAASAPTVVTHRENHRFSGTMRTKTFTIDTRAYTTGEGDVSAVSLVDARVDSGVIRHGARTAFGKFKGTPLAWTLDDHLYFEDGSIRAAGACDTQVEPRGRFQTRCRVTVNGGTGRFRGARGALTYLCNVASADINAIAKCDLKGTISY